MHKKEPLQCCRFRIFIGKTLKTYINIQISPMNTSETKFIIFSLAI